jgi:hypothetical protein
MTSIARQQQHLMVLVISSFSLSLALSFSSSMKESNILFNLSSSSNTGWKYSWRLLNKGGVGGSDGGGLNLRPDKKLLKRWWI